MSQAGGAAVAVSEVSPCTKARSDRGCWPANQSYLVPFQDSKVYYSVSGMSACYKSINLNLKKTTTIILR